MIDTLHDDAWMREAGGGFGSSGVEFLPDNKRVWFLSERDGWMHLYTLDVSDRRAKAKQLTEGKWEIASAELARTAGRAHGRVLRGPAHRAAARAADFTLVPRHTSRLAPPPAPRRARRPLQLALEELAAATPRSRARHPWRSSFSPRAPIKNPIAPSRQG